MSTANTGLAIYDHYDSLQPDNSVWAFPYNRTKAQQWQSIPAYRAVAERVTQALGA